jgi:hypothetical protein
MAGNGNFAQRSIAAVDEIRSGGEIVDNLARMSEAPVLMPRGTCVPAPEKRQVTAFNSGRRDSLAQASGIAWMAQQQ